VNAATDGTGPSAIGCAPLPACGVPARRDRLRQSTTLNGIDFVEVGDDGITLCVHLFGAIPQGLGVANLRLSGGDRITGLHVVGVSCEAHTDLHDDACLRVVLDREGDHGAYCLCIVDAASGTDPATWIPYAGFDPRYTCVALRFRLDCARDQDCRPIGTCVQAAVPPPEINYLAKDYASFRQLFLDRLALDLPAWQERHVPDLGIALVETLAYVADQLSYYQDAVATEAYLSTARRRISVRRHARLVDYRMHEGCNARALVTLASSTDLTLALDDLLLVVPPPGQANPVPGIIDAAQLDAARARGALIFEPLPLDGATTLDVAAAHTTIALHTWGDELCCLPRGSTHATLVDARVPPTPDPAPSTPTTTTPATRPIMVATHAPSAGSPASPPPAAAPQRTLRLAVGDLLIFEEVLSPRTGDAADADPTHRHAVRLTAVQPAVDPLDGTLLLEVAWDACDALPFDLCLSARRPAPDCGWLHGVSVAHGNVLLVDHGEHVRGQCTAPAICTPATATDAYPGLATALAALPNAVGLCAALGEDCWLVPGTTQSGCCHCEGAVEDVRTQAADTGHVLPGAPLTFAEPVPPEAPVCEMFDRDARAALPQLTVHGGPLANVLVVGTPDARWQWLPQYDLLECGPADRNFVVELDDDGAAHLRFGNGVLGAQPQAGDFFRAAVRLGNGPAGNAGRDSIVWLALKSTTLSADLHPRNPLPASGGTAPETLAEVKLYAPGAFHAHPLRAIVADDYAALAAQTPGVQGAAAALAWNGSWYTADVAVDPLGREGLPAPLAQTIAAQLARCRRIGHDVEVRGACYVPLGVALCVCVLPGFLAAQVKAALSDCFTSGLRRDGTPGFFHPDRLTLGTPVHASALLAAAQAITGVAHVEVTRLQRLDDPASPRVPTDGVLHLGAREIAQADNDPDHPDHGGIRFTTGGGR
jgi:hypothetical protein